ncbi:PEP-CTERM sorting domain-containing protein [Pseudoduganella sp. SL102]|uniref:PEP-CTERM sorting domain-containing protein n=1 Tax=Pseudoduganella sp. SL102 TaxID=2995154 RepID=UPI00248C8625|nr:PEP-CTERM sorting domain-containing protein [Pseudoduganella sp. SL102]WBS00561.1 PEP-CTERM sorting domain-containing protein [Pseudoduganella sp. SL102]
MTKMTAVRHSLLISAAMIFSMAQAMSANTDTVSGQSIAMQELQVDVTGILNNDERGATSNVIRDFYVGAGASITSLEWNVNVTSYAGSYLSEMQVTFSDTSGYGVTFTPGDGDDFDGTTDYAGFQDLAEIGQVFAVGADGILRLEFHDGFKDLAFDEPEGVWNSGTLTFGIAPVPEPSTYAMVLGGLLVMSGALKRRHAIKTALA